MKKNLLYAMGLALTLTGCNVSQSLMTHIPHLEKQGDIEVAAAAKPLDLNGPTALSVTEADVALSFAVTDHIGVQLSSSFLPDGFGGECYEGLDLTPPEPRNAFYSFRPAVGYFWNTSDRLSVGLYAGVDMGRQRMTAGRCTPFGLPDPTDAPWDVHSYEYCAAFGQIDLSWAPRPWVEVAGRLRLGWCDAFGYRGTGTVDADGSPCCWHDIESGFAPRATAQVIVDPMLQVSFGWPHLKASLSVSFDRTFCDDPREAPSFGFGLSYKFNPFK